MRYLPVTRFGVLATIGVALCAAFLVSGCAEVTDEPIANSSPVAQSASRQPLPSDDELRDMLDEVLDFSEARFLDADRHAAWQILHGVLAYGKSLQIYKDGELVPALDWILAGGNLRGWDLREGDHGLDVSLGVGNGTGQGHEDQWLAVLSQCGMTLDDPIRFRGKDYTVRDMMTQAQWDLYEGMEASWTVIGLTEYLPLDAEWTSKDGGTWTIERIMGMEAAENLGESACGGTHRLIGMTMALAKYENEGNEPTGGWADAREVIEASIKKAKAYQQPTGALSSSYFERASSTPDVAKQIGSSGHTLEFLTLALDDEEIRAPWVTRAVVHQCKLLKATRDMEVECGALYHAAHGLQIYRLRRFGERELPAPSSEAPDTQATTASDPPETVR